MCQQAGFPFRCAEMVSNRKLKLCDFYIMLIIFHFKYKPVGRKLQLFLFKSFSNFNLGVLFVISISKLSPMPHFKQIG